MDIIPIELNMEEPPSEKNEKQLLEKIQMRVDELLANDPELLMSYLYRLDVDEKRVQQALHPQSVIPPNEGIAILILERQKKRWETKRMFKQDSIDGWEF